MSGIAGRAARVGRTRSPVASGVAGTGEHGHQKRRYALQAAILIAVGVEPEDTSWWRHDDLWSHAFEAGIVFARAAAERRAVSVAEICVELRAGAR